MQIIIDIPDGDYKFIKDLQFYNSGRRSGRTIEQNVILGIRNGIPLPHEPNGDLISREVLKGLISDKSIPIKFEEEKRGDWQYASGLLLYDICKIIDNAPTVEADVILQQGIRNGLEHLSVVIRPQGKWVPISERLPESRDWYLGLFKEPDTDFIGIPYICDYVGKVTKGTTNEGWILRHCTDVDTVPDYFRNLICVAWQPLPEPYKESGAV